MSIAKQLERQVRTYNAQIKELAREEESSKIISIVIRIRHELMKINEKLVREKQDLNNVQEQLRSSNRTLDAYERKQR